MAWKRREIADRIRPVRERELERFARLRDRGRGFRAALRRGEGLAVIAEIKRRSPSAGAIAPETAAVEQARKYYNAGAEAISVLTDEKYFSGRLQDLWEVTDLMRNREDGCPCLRKDFMLHPIQVLEAAEAGAGAILIIVRALSEDEIKALFEAACLTGLDSLFEAHDEYDLERAVDGGAGMVGVNNRDLTRFTTDLAVSERLIPQIPSGIFTVSESGILTIGDAERVYTAGADAVLIGEALMRAGEPENLITAIHEL